MVTAPLQTGDVARLMAGPLLGFTSMLIIIVDRKM